MSLENSWILTHVNSESTKYFHHYFCTCKHIWRLKTAIHEPFAPDVVCPNCGNDYFLDADEFLNMKATKIWKFFNWASVVDQNEYSWSVTLKYKTPSYDEKTDELHIIENELLYINLKKDGSERYEMKSLSPLVSKYSLFLDESVQQFSKLLPVSAKRTLSEFIFSHRSQEIAWIDEEKIQGYSFDQKLAFIQFFLKHSHLQEHEFFVWNLTFLDQHTIGYPTQLQMLDFIADHRSEKILKKALYSSYEKQIKLGIYSPYSDYTFARTIDNVDFLVQLYHLSPDVKRNLFTEETFNVALNFMQFLKRHYTQKQITNCFMKEFGNLRKYKAALQHLTDTLRMFQTRGILEILDQHFIKVKLTTRALHNEVARISHIASYALQSKEMFDYDERYTQACKKVDDLEFKLPVSVMELGFWARMLRNCMFGYSRRIHLQTSIIYGVFRDDELLYGVEIQNLQITQAKAMMNAKVLEDDMKIIQKWCSAFSA